jgi:hypothetical protein
VNSYSPLSGIARIACLLLLLFSSQVYASGKITRAFSGIWDQPDHQSQGFIIQISEDDEENLIGVTYWFTYDGDLESAWYLAVGPVDGNQIDGVLYKTSGVTFLDGGIENNAEVEEIGTLLLTFRNCNQGTAAFDTAPEELGSGEVRIKRLTSIYNMRCSGGISDNTPGDARPLQLEVALRPVDPAGEGEGKAKFWERPGRTDLKVTVDDLAVDGTYLLKVCGEDRGTFEVEDGEGNLMFRSPANPGKKPLNFEPRECPFEILLDETVVLTSGDDVLAPKQPGDDDDEAMTATTTRPRSRSIWIRPVPSKVRKAPRPTRPKTTASNSRSRCGTCRLVSTACTSPATGSVTSRSRKARATVRTAESWNLPARKSPVNCHWISNRSAR